MIVVVYSFIQKSCLFIQRGRIFFVGLRDTLTFAAVNEWLYVECNEKLVPKYEIEFINNWNNFKNFYERIGGYFRNNSFVYKNESLIQESNKKGKILEEIYNLLNYKGLTNLLSKNTKDYISKYKSDT